MFDLKVINSVLQHLEDEKGIPREKVIDAIEAALATAYKKEYGKKHQMVKASFDLSSGKTEFFQIKKVVSPLNIVPEEEDIPAGNEEKVHFSEERHILLDDAKTSQTGLAFKELRAAPSRHDFVQPPFDSHGSLSVCQHE